MSLENCVQVDDGTWVDPADIVGVKHWPERYDKALGKTTPDNTVLSKSNGTAVVSYWPFERIKRALGLLDKAWIHKVWEQL